jgi:hypothetical protein
VVDSKVTTLPPTKPWPAKALLTREPSREPGVVVGGSVSACTASTLGGQDIEEDETGNKATGRGGGSDGKDATSAGSAERCVDLGSKAMAKSGSGRRRVWLERLERHGGEYSKELWTEGGSASPWVRQRENEGLVVIA